MAVTMELREDGTLIQLEGECSVTSAAELNRLLLEGLALGRPLWLDLEHAQEIDITVLQLLWAAGREAQRTGAGICVRMSEAAGMAAREAGFDRFPGLAIEA
jgi:anti-anti-sigma regulatory factor